MYHKFRCFSQAKESDSVQQAGSGSIVLFADLLGHLDETGIVGHYFFCFHGKTPCKLSFAAALPPICYLSRSRWEITMEKIRR